MQPDPIIPTKNSSKVKQTPRSPSQQYYSKENQQPNVGITPVKSKPQGKKYQSQIKPQYRPNSFSFQNSKEESFQGRTPGNNDDDDQDIEPSDPTTIRNVPMTRSIISSPPVEKSPVQQKNKQGGKIEQKVSHPVKNQNDQSNNSTKHQNQKNIQQLGQQIFPGSIKKFNQKKTKQKENENESANNPNQPEKNSKSEIKLNSTEEKPQYQSPQKRKSRQNLQKMQQKIKKSKERLGRSSLSKDDPQLEAKRQEMYRKLGQYNGKTYVYKPLKNLRSSQKSLQQSSQEKVEQKSEKKNQKDTPPRQNHHLSSPKFQQKSSPKQDQQKENPKIQKKPQQKGSPKLSQQIKSNQAQKKIDKKLKSPNPQKVNNSKFSPKTNQIKSPERSKDFIKEEQKAQIFAKTPQKKDELLSTPPRRTQSNKSQDQLLFFSSGKSQIANRNMTPNPNQQISLNLGSSAGRNNNSNSPLLLNTSQRSMHAQEHNIQKRIQQTIAYIKQVIDTQFHLEYPDVIRLIEKELFFVQRAPATQQQFRRAFPQINFNFVDSRQELQRMWNTMAEEYRKELLEYLEIVREKQQQFKRDYLAQYNVVEQKIIKQSQQGEQMVEKESNHQEKIVKKQQNNDGEEDNMFENSSQSRGQQPVPLQSISQNHISNSPNNNSEIFLIQDQQIIQPKQNKKAGKENKSPNNKPVVSVKEIVYLPSNDQQRMPNRYLNGNNNNNTNINLRNSVHSLRSSNKLSHSNKKKDAKKQIQAQKSQKRGNKGIQYKQKKTINQHRLQDQVRHAAKRCNDVRNLLSRVLAYQQHQYLRENFKQLLEMLEQIQEGLKISRFQKKLQSNNIKKCKKRITKLQLSFNQSYDLNITMSAQMQDQYKRELYQRKVRQLISEQDQECFEAFQMESLDDYYERHNKFIQPYHSEISESEDQNMNVSFSGQNNMNQHFQNSRQNNNFNLIDNNILQQSFGRNIVQVNPEQNRANFSFDQQNLLGSYSPSIQGVHGNILDSPIQCLNNGQNSQTGSPFQGLNTNSARQGTPQLDGMSQNMYERSNSFKKNRSPKFEVVEQSPSHLKSSNHNHNKKGAPRQNRMQHQQQNERMGFKQTKQKKYPNLIKQQIPQIQHQMKENQVENQAQNCRCRNKIKITDAILIVHWLQRMVCSRQVLRINVPIDSIHRQNVQQRLLSMFMQEYQNFQKVAFKVYDLARGNKKDYEKIIEQGKKYAKQSHQLKIKLQEAYKALQQYQGPNNQNRQINILSSQQAIPRVQIPNNQYKNLMHLKETLYLLKQLEQLITQGKIGNSSPVWQYLARQNIHPQLANQLKTQYNKTFSSVCNRFYPSPELTRQRFNQMNQLLQRINQPVRMQEYQRQLQGPLYQIIRSPVAGRIDNQQMVQRQPRQQMSMRQRNSICSQGAHQRQQPLRPERVSLRQSRRRQRVQRFRQSRRRLEHRSQPQAVVHQQPAHQQNRQNRQNPNLPTCINCQSIQRIAQDRMIFENKLKIKDINAILQWLIVLFTQDRMQDPKMTLRSIMKQKIDEPLFEQFTDLFSRLTKLIRQNNEIYINLDNQIQLLRNQIQDIGRTYNLKQKKSEPEQDFCQSMIDQAKSPDELMALLSNSSNNQGQAFARVIQYRMMNICEFLTACISQYPQEIIKQKIQILQRQDKKYRDKLQESGMPTTKMLDESIDCFLTQLIIDQQTFNIKDQYYY